ncbi:hypothetical protein [Actinomadura algeriensis]|uniref:VIT family protein n=1 Tax=Actinomadura algeriensis TaxID=1679523 RepID=A0ABR9JPP4_9ACTN|nr:hypothetical protein [Actinomadura algeriensis]MBE1532541.1 hypothetical protein [Actinomadura algeriensis]
MADPEERERDVASLEDDIFAVAQQVEVDGTAGPRIRTERAEALVERARAFVGRDVSALAAGCGAFVFVDLVMMYAPLMASDRPNVLPQFVALLMLAFGLGGLLVWRVGGRWRTFGYGMMLGWVCLSLFSVGLLTGLTALL